VVGSSTKTRFEARDDRGELVKLPELNRADDKQGKPMNINLQIGRPILALGNSNDVIEMLPSKSALASGSSLIRPICSKS
jgi:hypothetical protein